MTTTAPVDYDPLSPDLWRDPYPVYRRLRDESPVHHVVERNFWVLSRFEDVFGAVTDTESFSSAQGLTFEEDEIARLGLAPTLVMMDRPRHTDYRRLVNQLFTPRHVAGLEPEVRRFTRQRVQRLAQSGSDVVGELAGPLPALVVAGYLGVPESDRQPFGRWASAIVTANAMGQLLSAKEALAQLYQYFTDLLETRRRAPGDDMLSVLARAEIGGRRLETDEILGYCFVMIAGGNDTASGLISGSVAALTEHRDQRRRLLDDPRLVPSAVEELLRYVTPVQGLSRTTSRAVEIRGVTVPAGAKVHLLFASANRDDREFGPDAETLDVTRGARRMLAFSGGPHHCLGAAAARLQGRVVLEELLSAMPDFEVDLDAGRYAPGPFTRRFEYLPLFSGR